MLVKDIKSGVECADLKKDTDKDPVSGIEDVGFSSETNSDLPVEAAGSIDGDV